MKAKFDIKDVKITYKEAYEYFNSKRDSDTILSLFGERRSGDFYALFADAIEEIAEPKDYRPNWNVWEENWERASVFLTTNFALGNDYKYPETDEDDEVQDLLCFVQSGAYSLLIEEIEHSIDRRLDEYEKHFFIGCLQDLTYTVYEEQYGGDDKVPPEDRLELSQEELEPEGFMDAPDLDFYTETEE